MSKIFKVIMLSIITTCSFLLLALEGTSAAKQTFSDVKPSHYFYDNVMSMYNRNIISGFPDGTFKPNNSVTRGQAAKIIANTLGTTPLKATNPNFKDVFSLNSYYPYIASLYDQGVITNTPQYFRPNEPITRYELAQMIAAGFNLQSNSEKIPFNDVAKQYASAVSALYSNGITTGKSATKFNGDGIVTRAQIATFVGRAEEKNKALTVHLNDLDIPFNTLKTTGEVSVGYMKNVSVKFGVDNKNNILKIYGFPKDSVNVISITINKQYYYAIKKSSNTYDLVSLKDYNALGYTLADDYTVTNLPKEMFYYSGSIFIPKSSNVKEFQFVHDGFQIKTKVSNYDLLSETISIEVKNPQNIPLDNQQVTVKKRLNETFQGTFSSQKDGKLTLYFSIRAGTEFTAENLFITHEDQSYLVEFTRGLNGTTWTISPIIQEDPQTIAAEKLNASLKELYKKENLELEDTEQLRKIEKDYEKLSKRGKNLIHNYEMIHYTIENRLSKIASEIYFSHVAFYVKDNIIHAKISPLPKHVPELLEDYGIDFYFDFYQQHAKFYFPIVQKDLDALIPINGRNTILEKTFNGFVTYSAIVKYATTYTKVPLYKVGEVYEFGLFDISQYLENDVEVYIQPALNLNNGVSGGYKQGRYKLLGNYNK